MFGAVMDGMKAPKEFEAVLQAMSPIDEQVTQCGIKMSSCLASPDLGIWGFTTTPSGVRVNQASIAQSMNTMLGLFNLGGGEIILILALILILFGAKKLPELAKGLGQGIKEFKKATKEVTEEISSSMDET